MGMKPLYYRWDPVARSVHFSSEIPALLSFDAVSTETWTPGLDSYLASKTPFGEQTMFADIKVLPPATTMVCAFDQAPRQYRRQPPADELHVADEAAVAAEVHDTLRAEVERLLIADVPTAVITSGGLDSSLVTAFAAESDRDLHSFNIAYTGSWPSDERHFASQVAERAGTIHHQVEIDPATFPSLIEDVVWHLGQPNADPITLSSYALFSAVHEAGFKVTLTGDAADEVFGGYSRMRAAAGAAAESRPWYDAYLDQLAVLPAQQRRLLYTEEYRAHLREFDPHPGEATDRLYEGRGTVLERITDFELEHRLPAYHLRRVDHLSMASSVEVRLPFCQRGVVRLGRKLPDRMRIRDGKVKRVLYGAAEGLLPDQVLNRPKQPFTLPITAMLAPGWPLWDFAREVLHDHRLRRGGQLAPRAVGDLFAAQQARPNDTAALTIWALMVHEVWAEQFQGVSRKSETLAVSA
jgi:asparagine synthase (glutamine-hydrolysing)